MPARATAAPLGTRALGPSRIRAVLSPDLRSRVAPWCWGLLLALLAYAPALYEWDASGWGDWQQFHHWWEVGRVSITRFGEWPLWDPNHCGGVSMWGQPQAQMFAPTWWMTGLAFGTVHGHKLFILFHHVVGFAGMMLVARRVFGLSGPAAALTALAWAFSGFFAWRGAGGHSTFLAFHYLPWIYFCWRRAHDDLRYAAGVGALMGLVLFEGGTYPFPLTFLVLLFDSFAILIERPRAFGRVVRTALVSGTLTLMIGAARLWPIYLTMSRFPRATELDDTQTILNVLEGLTAREPHPWQWGHRWVWAEYGSFVGWAVIALAGYGVFLALTKRRHVHLVLGALLFLWCAMGGTEDHWPWPFLHRFPVFSNLHVPSRFHVLLTFYLTPIAGLAIERALRFMRGTMTTPGAQRGIAVLAWALVAAVGLDILSNDARIAARWDGGTLVERAEERFHLVGPHRYLERYATYPSMNVGTASCYDPVPWPISDHLWVGDVEQVRFAPRDGGALVDFERTNHRARAEVRLSAPARVIFNQNFDPDWRTSVGTPVDDQGRLAVDLPAGDHVIEASYQPADLPWSLLTTLLGLLLALALALRRRARARA